VLVVRCAAFCWLRPISTSPSRSWNCHPSCSSTSVTPDFVRITSLSMVGSAGAKRMSASVESSALVSPSLSRAAC